MLRNLCNFCPIVSASSSLLLLCSLCFDLVRKRRASSFVFFCRMRRTKTQGCKCSQCLPRSRTSKHLVCSLRGATQSFGSELLQSFFRRRMNTPACTRSRCRVRAQDFLSQFDWSTNMERLFVVADVLYSLLPHSNSNGAKMEQMTVNQGFALS